MTYAELRATLTTGSIVLFRGKGFVSDMICRICSLFSGKKTKYSHVGMIVADRNRKFVFESTTLNGNKGVQLNLLSTVLRSYKGTIVVRRLYADLTPPQHLALQQFISDSLHKPYERHIFELLGASTPWHLFDDNNSDYFCSELVAKVYQIWGFLPKLPAAKEYSPESFAVNGPVDKELLFYQGDEAVWLDEEHNVSGRT